MQGLLFFAFLEVSMVRVGDIFCPNCGGELHPYGFKSRYVRGKYGKRRCVKIRRRKCMSCGIVHNELPDFISPYVRYETDIFVGVIEGLITCETLGFEDYPSELTMWRWTHNLHSLLCHNY